MFKSDKLNDVINRYNNGKMPHAILFNTNNVDYLKSDLNLLIKNILCESEFCLDCDKCNLCHLIDEDSLPNLINIYPEGLQIKKDRVLELKRKFNTKPVYSKYNIYIINNCDFLNSSSANSILKFLEEPEDYILGFYITDNLEKVLSTIKSRCEIYNVIYDSDSVVDDDVINYSNSVINYIINNKGCSFIYKDLFEDLKLERVTFVNVFNNILNMFMEKYHGNSNDLLDNFKLENNSKIIELVKNTLLKIQSNVNIELAIIVFAVELSDLK